MDRIIAGFVAEPDRDLMLCRAHGVAYQADMTRLVAYDDGYFDKCAGYEGEAIALAINAGRIALVNRHVGAAARVVDVGIGSGEFIKRRGPNTFGTDVNKKAERFLRASGRWAADLSQFHAFTFWDVIEHVPDPELYFRQVPDGGFVFTSLPIFADLDRIRESKHYRPDEHLYYFTAAGFTGWMERHGFALMERADFETAAGRDSILSFAFRKCGG